MRFATLDILSNIAACYDYWVEGDQKENIQYTPENIFYVHKVSLLQRRYS